MSTSLKGSLPTQIGVGHRVLPFGPLPVFHRRRMLRTTKKEHKLQTKKPPCSMHSKFHNETRMLFRTRSNTSFSVWRGFRRNPPAHLRTASCHHINRLHHIPDRLHHIPDRLHHIPDRRPRVSCFSDLGSLGQVGFSFDLDQPNSSLYRFLVISDKRKSQICFSNLIKDSLLTITP